MKVNKKLKTESLSTLQQSSSPHDWVAIQCPPSALPSREEEGLPMLPSLRRTVTGTQQGCHNKTGDKSQVRFCAWLVVYWRKMEKGEGRDTGGRSQVSFPTFVAVDGRTRTRRRLSAPPQYDRICLFPSLPARRSRLIDLSFHGPYSMSPRGTFVDSVMSSSLINSTPTPVVAGARFRFLSSFHSCFYGVLCLSATAPIWLHHWVLYHFNWIVFIIQFVVKYQLRILIQR